MGSGGMCWLLIACHNASSSLTGSYSESTEIVPAQRYLASVIADLQWPSALARKAWMQFSGVRYILWLVMAGQSFSSPAVEKY